MTDDNGLSAPGSKKGKLQRVILKMLRAREHQPDGLPTNTRFIYYELVRKPASFPSHARRARLADAPIRIRARQCSGCATRG